MSWGVATLMIENVQSYPRPPRLEPVAQMLRVVLSGRVIAETQLGWRVCETHHPPTYYFPPQDVLAGVLRSGQGRSFCEWKERADYLDLVQAGAVIQNAAWTYATPTPEFAQIAGHLAFYLSDRVSGFVGDQAATPQPGGFYGGWVTPNLTGRIKGAPGTEGW
jgi:uncharacterized protein (DUF427 family)